MCGFAGTVGGAPPSRSQLEAALEAVRHRGPDEQRIWTDDAVSLAHARLSIIDRSYGSQPMITRDGRFAVVFNGEIYNHSELRAWLAHRGVRLDTRCDTEVLPYLYATEGPDLVHRLRGMFAFVIVDLWTREVFLARDRLGKKPLYLSASADAISFASTLDALLSLLPEPPEIDVQAIASYMVLQCVPGSASPWQGTEKIEPGTWIRWKSGELERQRYWRPPVPVEDPALDRRDVLEEVRLRIRDAVTSRLESEVPLGVFLSGGIDSSVVVAEMAAAGVRASTYSVGFDHAAYDESPWASMVADRFDADHHQLRLEADASSMFERFAVAYDEPFADSSALATIAVARAASDHVTVVLTGDGGDELFAGYDRYRAAELGQRIASRLGPLARPIASAVGWTGDAAGIERLAMTSRFIEDPWAACRDHQTHFTPEEARVLLHPELAEGIDADAATRRLDGLWATAGVRAGRAAWVEAHTYLPDDLLTKMDRATMSWGIEARSPLLDHELWEWAARLPRAWLMDARAGKRLLRDAYQGVLPPEILQRRKKGFSVPLAAWLRGQLRPHVEASLLSDESCLWRILQPEPVRSLAERFLRGDDALRYRVWNLVALTAWYEPRQARVRA